MSRPPLAQRRRWMHSDPKSGGVAEYDNRSGVVEQPPAVAAHVDSGLGVLDDGAVLDVLLDLPVADVGSLGDLVQRLLPDHGVGPDPEGGVVVGHALVHDVLQVRGGPGDPLQPGRRAGERAVRRLGDSHVLVLLLLEQVHKAKAVLRQQHAVRVERDHVIGVGNGPAGAGPGRDERGAAHGLDLVVAAAHQPDVAVEVHRLVRLVRQ